MCALFKRSYQIKRFRTISAFYLWTENDSDRECINIENNTVIEKNRTSDNLMTWQRNIWEKWMPFLGATVEICIRLMLLSNGDDMSSVLKDQPPRVVVGRS